MVRKKGRRLVDGKKKLKGELISSDAHLIIRSCLTRIAHRSCAPRGKSIDLSVDRDPQRQEDAKTSKFNSVSI